ncbi:hypothetical protein D018_2847A, partial [Vibrio parahaemolyticus VP2007-007]
MIASGV